MAGDWLKFEKATPDKPEVFAIASALDLDPDAVVGKLIRIWSWFDTHTTTGNARSVTPALLDRIAGVTGFVLAMCSVGWVEVTDDGVSLPNFDRHTGETAKGRALGAKRASEHRGKSNAPTVTKGVTTPLPREEKRREEIKAPVVPSGDMAAIVSAYHDHCPMMPAVSKMTDNRKRKLKARWFEDPKRQTVDYWARFFAYVAKSDFLTGRDRAGWTGCDFEWLIEPANHVKVIEGKYENREAKA